MKYWFVVLVLGMFLTACDPCTGCGPVTYEPTVSMRFVDAELEGELVTETAEDSVYLIWTGFDTTFHSPNSLARLNLPLDIVNPITSYILDLDAVDYAFTLEYTLSQELSTDNQMLIRALDIQLTNSPFDSVVYECGFAGCIDKQTKITCYY